MSLLQTRTRIAAGSAVVVASAVAPMVVWYVNESPLEPLVARPSAALNIELPISGPPLEETEDSPTVHVDEILIVAQPPPPTPRLPARTVKAALSKTCVWHQSVALARGKVKICDIERPATGQGQQLLAPLRKPTSLGHELDVASPTGLLEASRRSSTRSSPLGRPKRDGHAIAGLDP